MPGPPPKPTALKVLQGNPGKKRLPDGEPQPPLGGPPPQYVMDNPALLRQWTLNVARCPWRSEADPEAFAAMCVMELAFQDAARDPEASPMLLAKLSQELRGLWAKFGLTPADRTRIKVEQPKPAGKLQGFRGGKAG